MNFYSIEFPKYPGEGTSTFAKDEEQAKRVVRADVERRLGLWPQDVVVTHIRTSG